MKKAVFYIHGKGGSAQEAERFAQNCPGHIVVGAEYQDGFPWEAKKQIWASYKALCREYSHIVVLANSIGAYFAMLTLGQQPIEQALFISPVLDMERLIRDMMQWAGVTEQELLKKGEIPTDFGETLSWEYLSYVREHPVQWQVPTEILYAGGDSMTSRKTLNAFLAAHPASLTVMEEGEHWFHTPEQLAFLDQWMQRVMAKL